MATCFLNCNFLSVKMIFGFLKLNLKIGLAEKYYRSLLMTGPINKINNIVGYGIYQTPTNMPAERNGSNVKGDIAKISPKYILENNKIVFERYDRHGKLISRVPWAAHPISKKA